ncbi:uncharacterized protein LOC141714587 [Apium graveolens]|uniref:uncharacterized protein LOC141714587 n=1 Tax=Apium graveolens TaxID=4045 RepID=UPI003D7AA0B0
MRPDPKETLQLYLAVSDRTLGAVLVKNYEGNQHPVFYVSHVLKDVETRYPNAEKFAYGLVMASQKLRHYFQGRTVQGVTDQPLKKILTRPKASGRVVAWSIELGEFDVEYVPRTAIKAQALVDFVVEYAFLGPKDLSPEEQLIRIPGKWKLFVDGSVIGKKCGAGLILSSPEGFKICQAIRFDFPLTNNEAEYEALLAGMKLARSLEVKHLRAFSDSMLVVKHFTGEYEQRDPRTRAYATKASFGRDTKLNRFYLPHRSQNAFDRKERMPRDSPGKRLDDPLRNFLEKGILPPDRKDALKVKYRASSYTIINGRMYRRSVSQPLLRCLNSEEQQQALEAVHEGICGEHLAGRSLAFKILWQGFFWPTLKADAIDWCKKMCTMPVVLHCPEETSRRDDLYTKPNSVRRMSRGYSRHTSYQHETSEILHNHH